MALAFIPVIVAVGRQPLNTNKSGPTFRSAHTNNKLSFYPCGIFRNNWLYKSV